MWTRGGDVDIPVPVLGGHTARSRISAAICGAGTCRVALGVSDGRGGTAEQDFVITVANVPDRPPVFTSTPVIDAYYGTAYTYLATATDPDSDPLTFSLVSGPSGLGINPNTGVVSWTPSEAQEGNQTVTLQVSDGHAGEKNAPAECEVTQAKAEISAAANRAEPAPCGDDLFEDHLGMVRAIADNACSQRRRHLERRVRQRAVDFSSALSELGYDRGEAARRLGLAERTLRHWQHELSDQPVVSLGRPLADSGAAQQQAVVGMLHQFGPGVGVPRLRQSFPGMARSELTELVRCYRCLWQTQHTRVRHVLRWLRAGTVWAMDFAEAPWPIDERFPYLLAVRDLASGRQLLWRAVRATSAEVVVAELTPLFNWRRPSGTR